MQTSSGFFTDDFTHWPGALPVILMLSTFIGGCAGSTSGGMKVVRWLLLWKQGQREVVQLVHPSAEVPVKLGQKADRSARRRCRVGLLRASTSCRSAR